MYEQIVRKDANQERAPEDSRHSSAQLHIEASLLPQQRQILPYFSTLRSYNSFSKYLTKKVRRNPRDLRSHVQRTFLLLAKGDIEALYGALIDLFIILGDRGIELRKNLVARSKPILTHQQYEFLMAHMESGLDTNEPLPLNTFSSLSKGQAGTSNIVRRKHSNNAPTTTAPVELAKQQLLQKDWFTAMMILENALQQDPGDADVCSQLLELYKQQNTREAFVKTYSTHIGRSLALPELWSETEQFFLNSTDK
ncbi:MAG: hypothetical protein P8163_08980 [Candidatus Thiodiazotropha sp.]